MRAELSEAEVAAMGRAAATEISADDLPEVTVRVNAFLEALAGLDALPLDGIAPVPAAPHPTDLP
ncbi:MAG TPA: hypothetical protein VJP45_02945 [Candidatus Limnocylindria bacterium]|nr:hypothetical protein [Candidatus Limnocylindria bacterium]